MPKKNHCHEQEDFVRGGGGIHSKTGDNTKYQERLRGTPSHFEEGSGSFQN